MMLMIRPILQLGNDVLRRKSLTVTDFPDHGIESLVQDLFDTLYHAQKKFKYGNGIAAPQIGVLKRVIVVDIPCFQTALINPRIVNKSEGKFEVWDSCFSFNLAFLVLVDRCYAVKVKYSDPQGEKKTISAKGRLSELLQHEIDHLEGILATDRMKSVKGILMRSEWEARDTFSGEPESLT